MLFGIGAFACFAAVIKVAKPCFKIAAWSALFGV